MDFNLPRNVEFILEKLKENGYDAYIVGGSVRDLLCGKTPDDFDITTNALPTDIKSIFPHTANTGIKHGTVTVVVDKTPVEVTTFRTEGGYQDSRHPDNVNFVNDISLDLSRRDFTVNAMAFNKTDGLIDIFGGKNDIEKKILRAVGDPKKRFTEDALRILRLFRFASTLDFSIEEKTFSDALACSHTLANISAERICTELKKAVCGTNPAALSPLIKSGALKNFGITKEKSLNDIKLLNHKDLKIFAFLNLCCDNIIFTANALKFSNQLRDYCKKANKLVCLSPPKDKIGVKLQLSKYEDVFNDVLNYRKFILKEDIEDIFTLYNDVLNKGEPYKISDLKITGDDLKKAGLVGPLLGETLQNLLLKVIEKPELNQKAILLNLI